LELSAR